jgi:hypothetical protein
MKKKSPLLGALPIIAQALGRRLGVNVVIGGSRACTNGRTVYLPELPAEGESLAVLANGFIDHEAAHIRYTDFTVQKPEGLAGQLAGLLEDIRIEQALGADYPGSRDNLAALVAYLETQDPVRLPPEGAAEIPVMQALYCILRAQVLGQQALAPAATAMEGWIEQRLPEGVVVKLLALAFEVRRAASTADAQALALRIVAMLEDEATRPPESPPTGDGAGGHGSLSSGDAPETGPGPSSSGNAGDAGAPGASPSDPAGSDPQDSLTPSDTPDAGLDSSTSGDATDTPDAGQDSSASGASGDGAGSGAAADAVRRQALASLLASDDEDRATDLGARAGQWLVDAMAKEENRSQRVTLAEYDDPPSNRDPAAAVAQARAATAQLRRRLGTLVQAHRNDEAWLSRRGHRLDTTGLYRLNTGDPARFLRYGERAAPATAVGLLLDRSGSMNHQIDLAGQAVLATALALEDLDGVSCWAAAFPGVYYHQIVPLKGFAERTRRVAGRFGLAAGGGTPLATALWRAGFELIRRPEPRRLLIVATDGQPNDVDAAHDILGRCRTSGIEVIGLGIGQSLTEVRAVFGDRDATAIEAITALAPALFALLEQRLAPAG